MKGILGIIVLFIIVLFISIIINFPMENAVEYNLNKIGNATGLVFQYESGKFYFGGADLENFTISKEGKPLITLEEVLARPGLGRIRVKGKKGEGNISMNLSSSNTSIQCKNFQAISEGTKFFKKLILTGTINYNMKEKKGKGKFRVNMLESLQPALVNSDILSTVSFNISPEEIKINVEDLQGMNLRGSGEVGIKINNQDFKSSGLSGSLNIKKDRMPLTLSLSGTLGNIQAVPQMGGQK